MQGRRKPESVLFGPAVGEQHRAALVSRRPGRTRRQCHRFNVSAVATTSASGAAEVFVFANAARHPRIRRTATTTTAKNRDAHPGLLRTRSIA